MNVELRKREVSSERGEAKEFQFEIGVLTKSAASSRCGRKGKSREAREGSGRFIHKTPTVSTSMPHSTISPRRRGPVGSRFIPSRRRWSPRRVPLLGTVGDHRFSHTTRLHGGDHQPTTSRETLPAFQHVVSYPFLPCEA